MNIQLENIFIDIYKIITKLLRKIAKVFTMLKNGKRKVMKKESTYVKQKNDDIFRRSCSFENDFIAIVRSASQSPVKEEKNRNMFRRSCSYENYFKPIVRSASQSPMKEYNL